MAPIQRKRATARAKASRAVKPIKPSSRALLTTNLSVEDDSAPASTTFGDSPLFPPSKKDKQKIKHSAFVSRITKPGATTKKRRRPSKKLVTTLESLADALPDVETGSGGEGTGRNADRGVVIGQARIQRKSLKSRPGAMKRKEKLEKMERERFNANLVQMAKSGTGAGGSGIADRWAALKNHVRSTVEVKPEFNT
ncbi:hypothetical protein P154DRAFT_455517 [Amniculicola lignicola CBS 123094]|uniref:Ribosome biogenesis protein SLX9 n=1 Tax=Amniculicola lignicola CBS 123094 TaxID=1392246 RepID=A0A6A5X2V6_9PLEO|nr:hypothetical protein P154DRAFT_455517 [Amniculicola lignicola CBS 123094]